MKFPEEAVVYIDTCGCECEEFNTGVENASKGNLGEAVIVDKVVTNLVKVGLPHKDIGVITPYALQVSIFSIGLCISIFLLMIFTLIALLGGFYSSIICSKITEYRSQYSGRISRERKGSYYTVFGEK